MGACAQAPIAMHWRHLIPVSIAISLFSGCARLPPLRVIADAKVNARLESVMKETPVQPELISRCGSCDAPRIAVVDVDGLLLNYDLTGLYSDGENPVAVFRERLDAICADPQVVAVVVRINSPGGGVTASDIMWHDLFAFKQKTKLPVIVCLLDLGAGGGYYLATAGDHIMAHPTTITGGIGVILNTYNLQDTMAQFNIVGAPIKAGKNVDLGTPIKAMEDNQRKILQTMADEFHDRFRRNVEQRRPDVDVTDGAIFDGRVFTAEQALERHLIDSIGYLDDAVEMGREIARAPHAEIVFYHRKHDQPRSLYDVTPNVPLQGTLLPLSIPGVDRSKLPSFLYLWQPDPTMEKLGGR